MTKKDSQCKMIADYMREHGSITPHDAFRKPIRSMKLAARIHDLRRKGFWISTEIEHYKDADGDDVHFARYRIVYDPEIQNAGR